MDKRTRSPNYPSMSLREAVQKAGEIYRSQHTHGAPREVVAQSMGYNSLNGASATAISALMKFGLLDGRGEDIKISALAMAILHPESDHEKASAIAEAAGLPALYSEIDEKFPGRPPSDEILKNYLVRRGFAQNAIPGVISAYRETKEFVVESGGLYSAQEAPTVEAKPMQQSFTQPHPGSVVPPMLPQGDVEVGGLNFQGVGSVRIMASRDLDPRKALTMAETVIAMMRAELAAQHKALPLTREDDKDA